MLKANLKILAKGEISRYARNERSYLKGVINGINKSRALFHKQNFLMLRFEDLKLKEYHLPLLRTMNLNSGFLF